MPIVFLFLFTIFSSNCKPKHIDENITPQKNGDVEAEVYLLSLTQSPDGQLQLAESTEAFFLQTKNDESISLNASDDAGDRVIKEHGIIKAEIKSPVPKWIEGSELIPNHCYYIGHEPEKDYFYLDPYKDLQEFRLNQILEISFDFYGIICLDADAKITILGSIDDSHDAQHASIKNILGSYLSFSSNQGLGLTGSMGKGLGNLAPKRLNIKRIPSELASLALLSPRSLK